MDFLDSKDVAMIGRKQNAIVMEYEKSILITTDILMHNGSGGEPHMTFDQAEEKIEMFAKDIMLMSKISTRPPDGAESVVYGESLVELLKWMIGVLKTHSHPPNAPAIPSFHAEANSRLLNMEYDLLNKHVQTR